MLGMNTAERLYDCASGLVEAARDFQAAAEQPGSHSVASDTLASLEEVLQALSAAWYRLAADASPGVVERRGRRAPGAQSPARVDGLSREQEVRLVGTLHDVAAAFARCARACRVGRSTIRPIIARGADRAGRWVFGWGRMGACTDRREDAPGARSPAYPLPKEADVPNGIYPVPKFRFNPGQAIATRPGLALRIRTRLRRHGLDGELARGADPAASTELSLRAQQLCSAAERSRLANALVDAMGDAARPEPVAIRSRPQRFEVLKCREDLQALVERLRDDRPVAVRGAAMTARLLNDGGSPLRRDGGPDLRHAVRAARFALDATDPATEDLARAA
jgi:hypothetical protein